MLVYRVEDKNNHGPYGFEEFLKFNHNYLNGRPGPNADKTFQYEPYINSCSYFAFKNFTQLKKWFSIKDRIKLFHNNFKVSVYEIEEDCVNVSDFQVIFEFEYAKKIKTISFNSKGNIYKFKN